MASITMEDLAASVGKRAKASPSESYTAELVGKGVPHCARKLGEEAVETIIAATSGDRAALTAEAADLLYHLLVLLEASGVPFADVTEELGRRTKQSGHSEKASRPS